MNPDDPNQLLEDFLVFLRKEDVIFSGDRLYLGRHPYTFHGAIDKYWETYQ